MTRPHISPPAYNWINFVLNTSKADFVTWLRAQTALPHAIRLGSGSLYLQTGPERRSKHLGIIGIAGIYTHDIEITERAEKTEPGDVECVSVEIDELSKSRVRIETAYHLPAAALYHKQLLDAICQRYPEAQHRIDEQRRMIAHIDKYYSRTLTGTTWTTPTTLDVLDAATLDYLYGYAPLAGDARREVLTPGSVVYRMIIGSSDGDIGDLRLRKLAEHNSVARCEIFITEAPKPDEEIAITELVCRALNTRYSYSLDEKAESVVKKWLISVNTATDDVIVETKLSKSWTDAIQGVRRSIHEARQKYHNEVFVPQYFDRLAKSGIECQIQGDSQQPISYKSPGINSDELYDKAWEMIKKGIPFGDAFKWWLGEMHIPAERVKRNIKDSFGSAMRRRKLGKMKKRRNASH